MNARALAIDLVKLGVRPGMTLLVHSSLRSLGWVEGGVTEVIAALRAAVGETGTVMVPAHTAHLTDPSSWANPPVPEAQWPAIRAELPVFRAERTASWGMGAIAEGVRKHPEALRSAHPLHSFAALGPAAEFLLTPHALDWGLGEASPLARLEQCDARVLLLGVDHSVNTTLHLAEYRARWPRRRLMRTAAPLEVAGVKTWVEFDELDHESTDFAELGRAWTAEHHGEGLGQVAAAPSQLVPVRSILAFAVPWLSSHRS